jgi:hypothetical protein
VRLCVERKRRLHCRTRISRFARFQKAEAFVQMNSKAKKKAMAEIPTSPQMKM